MTIFEAAVEKGLRKQIEAPEHTVEDVRASKKRNTEPKARRDRDISKDGVHHPDPHFTLTGFWEA